MDDYLKFTNKLKKQINQFETEKKQLNDTISKMKYEDDMSIPFYMIIYRIPLYKHSSYTYESILSRLHLINETLKINNKTLANINKNNTKIIMMEHNKQIKKLNSKKIEPSSNTLVDIFIESIDMIYHKIKSIF